MFPTGQQVLRKVTGVVPQELLWKVLFHGSYKLSGKVIVELISQKRLWDLVRRELLCKHRVR